MVFLSLLIAQSLALFLFEGLLPVPFLAPGAKLGLANIITVLALYTLSVRDTFLIVLLRTLLGSLFGGGPAVFLYSITGGILSLAAMIFLKRTEKFSILGVSAAGGFMHNVGQLLIAALVIENTSIFGYLPILGPCGIITGICIGILALFLQKKLSPIFLSRR